MPRSRLRSSLLLAAAALCAPSASDAQFVGFGPTRDRAIRVEVEKPFFIGNEFGTAGSILHAAYSTGVNERVALTAAASLAYGDRESQPASVALSNVHLQLTFGDRGSYAHVFANLPLSASLTDLGYAAQAGFAADVERPEYFQPDVMAVGLGVTPKRTLASGAELGGRGTVVVLTPSGLDPDLYLRFAGFAERAWGPARVGADLTGGAILSGASSDVGAISVLYLTLHAEWPDRGGSPALYARLPIENDSQQFLELALGVRLSF